jgi:hypothetical protein
MRPRPPALDWTAEIRSRGHLRVVIRVVDLETDGPSLMSPWTATVNRHELGSRLRRLIL